MDFQNRAGGKTGSGGVASSSESNRDRRERLRQLALETIDLNKDPYFMKNHLGSYECKLCLTLHNNEGSYLAHTQGKKHQSNLGRRAAKDAKDAPAQPAPEKARVEVRKFVKIGRPGYKVTKQKDPDSGQQSLLFQVDYPEIAEITPRHRFMAAYEQKIEPPDKNWQYLLFAAEPYETIAFKVPSREVDKNESRFWTQWNRETKQFFLQFHFKMEPKPISAVQSAPPMKGSAPPANLPPPPGMQRGPPHGMKQSDHNRPMRPNLGDRPPNLPPPPLMGRNGPQRMHGPGSGNLPRPPMPPMPPPPGMPPFSMPPNMFPPPGFPYPPMPPMMRPPSSSQSDTMNNAPPPPPTSSNPPPLNPPPPPIGLLPPHPTGGVPPPPPSLTSMSSVPPSLGNMPPVPPPPLPIDDDMEEGNDD
ncbi:splicing factor 3A subunit 2-like [Antedon mediterranea]|uniref:splicing factor 3A subunit 2-like n=1 Tax=Antedon mediterranea TaxID=105859 RepID=UPI003AF577B8